ncbi:centromere protein P isoform X6 [Ailuropoda melanoleuca]|uniref:centromere protein P isoform X6 n=1 Tax=Ailuropoda melanoleuca TaxID=9646 RepID=UPI0014940057|nr:centromere protein P isoform X6 [Ailuropoda melanoleuca]
MDAQRAEVRALEAEIAALRRACEEPRAAGEYGWRARKTALYFFGCFYSGSCDGKSLREMYQSDSEGWASSKDLRSHLGHLESELLFLSTLTGISIRNYSMKTEDLTNTEKTEKSMKKVLQRHRLSGNCHMITFQLEFQILEIQDKENLSSVITDLNIIMEPTEYSELSEFVSRLFCSYRAEERRDLLMFFRSLHFFVEWCEYRKRTFEHFKKCESYLIKKLWLLFLLHQFLSFIRFSLHLKKQNTRTSSFSTVPYGTLRLVLVKLICFVSNLRSGTQILFCSGVTGGNRRILSTTLCCEIPKTN